MSAGIERLIAVMARLRNKETGCKWDLAQDFASIAPYTIEEAYEVSDAIERKNWSDLQDELGDLLLQVVFHSRIAEEYDYFTFEDVVQTISDKMKRRHPHIFGDQNHNYSPDAQQWETIKKKERHSRGETSAMDGIAISFPALMRAEKLQKRAARDGFDWPDTYGPERKLAEEMTELAEASDDKKLEEAGDVLFAAVNLVRAYGISAEEALRSANTKFERRYRSMEQQAEGEFNLLDFNAQEALWKKVKEVE
ncbi:MAG: nucleoside triphosphate pyrophosphohydrolase [Sphingomonadaceae bacterium]